MFMRSFTGLRLVFFNVFGCICAQNFYRAYDVKPIQLILLIVLSAGASHPNKRNKSLLPYSDNISLMHVFGELFRLASVIFPRFTHSNNAILLEYFKDIFLAKL